ncbi:MAG TPA: RtcB family protein [Candidatus Acidoferrum sp.]|jgi:tRNA-splicing ligase RtcB|nr:RtcB family protein [Candidatus Acidoferrum sp.]
MELIDGIAVFGDPIDDGALAQIRRTKAHPAVRAAALMADHHKGYAVPIGGVVAYEGAISPSGVGYDIACGNKAVLTDMSGAEARAGITKIMDDIVATISFGVGRTNAERVDHELFDDPAWSVIKHQQLRDKAGNQLGTVGSGNHYVDVFTDEQDRVWVGVHFGSRGFGHGIATWALKAGGASDGMDVDPLVLTVDSDLGAEYIAAMHLAGRYAYAGRDWVANRVTKILGANQLDEVHNHHNFAWLEKHGGQDVWVVRKGATPAFAGQRGFVGGSMGDDAVILEGIDASGNPMAAALNQEAALFSTVHGAGRVMSRNAARGRRKKVGGRWEDDPAHPGRISRDDMQSWIAKRGVVLRGADTDEAPQAYKRLPEVLRHHRGTVRVLHTLSPIGVAMAGAGEFDPYKD